MVVLISITILACFTLIGLSVWGVLSKKYDDGNALEEIQHLSDVATELIETAVIYKQIGMEKEAMECVEEAARLNTQVWEVINGVNN